MLSPDSFYELDKYDEYSSYDEITKCGECWAEDIEKTEKGEYTGDEAVKFSNLRLLNDNYPFRCDDCGKQNAAYEDMVPEQ